MSVPVHVKTAPRSPVYAFVGNPNCGKSTLFNALTGLKQKVGNYPGVTVERKIGTAYSQHGQPMTVIDLPGAYSLAARSPDEAVTRDVLLGRRSDTEMPDRVVCIVDASNLERNLYLVHQILDLGRPVILVVNMMDLATKAGLEIRINRIEKELGIPVIAAQAARGQGVIELKLAMSRQDLPLPRHSWDIPADISSAVSELQASLQNFDQKPPLIARAESLLLLTDQDPVRVSGSQPISPQTSDILRHWKTKWAKEGTDWAGTLVAARYNAIGKLTAESVQQVDTFVAQNTSDQIDAITTHGIWGWAVLGTIMTALFLSIFTLAEYPMSLIETAVAALSDGIKSVMSPGDLRDLITDGAIAGVGGVVIFLPQILILFFFIGLLESTGYMARAAFIMDRLMGKVGLNGKSFIPLLSSYACAIPGIMATRTIEDPKDRLVTILVAPFMSCSARLPVYLLMIAALVPDGEVPLFTKVGLMLLMYALGTFGAFGFAWLFKRTLLKGEPPLMIMELPPYRMPKVNDVILHMFQRAGLFLKRAGTIILAISIVLWALTAYPKANDDATAAEQIAQSYAGQAGKLLEPAIKPLGFNWEIGIGLISSFAAREVFVSSMSVVFNVEEDDEDTAPLREALQTSTWPDGRTLFTPLVCLTLMIFYVFAMQCISTVAIVKRETNSWKWPLFQIGYQTGFAWILCFAVFQIGSALGY
jgi:ferrous iron transport protein B